MSKEKGNVVNGIVGLLIIALIGAGGYYGVTYFLDNSDTAVDLGISKAKMVSCSDIEKRENDMGLMEAYYEGEKFTGMSIVAIHTMESGSIIYQVMEYRDGGVLNGGSWDKIVDENGEEVQHNPNKIENSESNLEECLMK